MTVRRGTSGPNPLDSGPSHFVPEKNWRLLRHKSRHFVSEKIFFFGMSATVWFGLGRVKCVAERPDIRCYRKEKCPRGQLTSN